MTEGCVTHLLAEIEKIASDIETLYDRAKAAAAVEPALSGVGSAPYIVGYMKGGCCGAAGDLRSRARWMRQQLEHAREDAAEALAAGGGVR